MKIYITSRLTKEHFIIGTLSKAGLKLFYFYKTLFDDNEFIDWWNENKDNQFFTLNGDNHIAKIIDSLNGKIRPQLLFKHEQIVVDIPPRKYEVLFESLREKYLNTKFATFQTDIYTLDCKLEKFERKDCEDMNDIVDDITKELRFIEDKVTALHDKISLCYELSSEYKTSLINIPAWKVSELVILNDMKRTNKEEIEKVISHGRFNPVDFCTSEFNLKSDCQLKQITDVIEKMNNIHVKNGNLNGIFKEKLNIKGLEISVGMGGLHGVISGEFKADKEFALLSYDIVSYYPSLIVNSNMEPIQLKGLFHNSYKKLYDKKMNGDKRYKWIINDIYGLTNFSHSLLYDPMFTAFITLTGEIRMLEVLEIINSTNAIPIKINTDGFDIIIPKNEIEQFELKLEGWKLMYGFSTTKTNNLKATIKDNGNYFILGGKNVYSNNVSINNTNVLSFDIAGDKTMLNKYLFNL